MSRVIHIKGKVVIQNIELAKECIAVSELNIKIENNQFCFNEYDALDRINESQKAKEIIAVEELYSKKFVVYLEKIAEEERAKIEEEKRKIREEKYEQIIQNAKEQGYKLKKEVRADNTIKLVLQKRVY